MASVHSVFFSFYLIENIEVNVDLVFVFFKIRGGGGITLKTDPILGRIKLICYIDQTPFALETSKPILPPILNGEGTEGESAMSSRKSTRRSSMVKGRTSSALLRKVSKGFV